MFSAYSADNQDLIVVIGSKKVLISSLILQRMKQEIKLDVISMSLFLVNYQSDLLMFS